MYLLIAIAKKVGLASFVFLLCFSFAEELNGQSITQFCGTPDDAGESQQKVMQEQLTHQIGGRHITEEGTLKILVVFARFPDDTDANGTNWPEGTGFPSFVNTIIDDSPSVGSTNKINITNYFDQMSLGKLTVIGDAVTVTASNNESFYNNNLSDANRSVWSRDVALLRHATLRLSLKKGCSKTS